MSADTEPTAGHHAADPGPPGSAGKPDAREKPSGLAARTDAALNGAERLFARLLDWAAGAGWRPVLLILAVAFCMILPGLAAMPVTDRDEARFAQASKQMVETGDLIDIRFQDQPRWKKPAGIYWLQAASASAMGGTEAPILAYRLPSALAAALAGVLMVWAARPLVGRRAATFAGLMLVTTLLTVAEAHIAKTDAALLATAVVVLGGLARLMPEASDRPTGTPLPAGPFVSTSAPLGWPVVGAVWTAVAAAILIKGPIVPLIALLALGWLWIAWRRPPPLGRLRPLPGLVWTGLLVAPWLAAIWVISDGRFFADSVGGDLVGKVVEGQEKHWGPPGLYLVLVWATFWPWAALLPAAVPWAWAHRREDWLRLLAGWVVPFWLILEAVPTKLPHYVLPLYAGLAIGLAAWALAPDRPQIQRWARRWGAVAVAAPGGALALAMLILGPVVEGRMLWAALPFALAGALATALAARAMLTGRVLGFALAVILASASLSAGVLQVGLPALATAFPSPRIAALAAPWRPCASGPLITAGYREPSLVFLTETGTRLATPPEAARALRRDPGALVLLEDRWRPLLERHWRDRPPRLVERGRIAYFNYNRGSFETARLVTTDDPRWKACRS